jgi:hypothetical protein
MRVQVALWLLGLGSLVVVVLGYVHVSGHLNEQSIRQGRFKFKEEQPLSQGTQLKAGGPQYYAPYQYQGDDTQRQEHEWAD